MVISRLQCVAKKVFRPKEKSRPPPSAYLMVASLLAALALLALRGLGLRLLLEISTTTSASSSCQAWSKSSACTGSPSHLLLLLQYYSDSTIGLVSVSVTASVADTGDNHDSISRPAGKADFRRPINPFPSGHLLFGNKRSFVHVSFIGPTSRLPVGLYRCHWWSDNGGERLSVHVVNYDFTK